MMRMTYFRAMALMGVIKFRIDSLAVSGLIMIIITYNCSYFIACIT